MSKGIKKVMNLDKLEICYIGRNENITEIENQYRIEKQNFYLKRLERDDNCKYYKVVIYDSNKENGELEFGELKIGNAFEKSDDKYRYCWLSIYNENLYVENSYIKLFNYIYPLQDELELFFNNFTCLEIAIDANFNWYKRIWKQILNSDTTNVILNRSYPNTKDTLKGLVHEFSCTSEKLLNGTIRIVNKEKDMKFHVYDKTQEILDNSGKMYILDRFVSIKKIFRAEIMVKNKALEDYCIKEDLSQYDIYMRLNDEKLLMNIFNFFSDRLIHFIDNRRNKISIIDL